MRPPASASSTDEETVEGVTTELQPKAEAELRAEISHAVRREIALLRSTIPGFFDRKAIRKTRDNARAVITTIARLEEQLQEVSPLLWMRLQLGAVLEVAAEPSPVERLLHALRDVRAECQAAADALPGTDQVKLWCVRVAMRPMLRFSAKRPAVGSDASPFCTIAGLLYEGVTGEKDQSLRRVCKQVLEQHRSLLPP